MTSLLPARRVADLPLDAPHPTTNEFSRIGLAPPLFASIIGANSKKNRCAFPFTLILSKEVSYADYTSPHLSGFHPRRTVLVVIGIIAVLIAVLLSVLGRAREQANRVKCASNLRSIGQQMRIYAHDNKGQYPRVRYARGSSPSYFLGSREPNPFDGRTSENDVTSAYFLLVRYGMLKTSHFVCPSGGQEPDDLEGRRLSMISNFMDARPLGRHWGYSFANPYPIDGSVGREPMIYKFNTAAPATTALAADRNDGDRFRAADPDAPAADVRAMNSRNHKQEGQNVLFNDGAVVWHPTPFCGHARDHIFTADARGRGPHKYPYHRHDSILLPLFPLRDYHE